MRKIKPLEGLLRPVYGVKIKHLWEMFHKLEHRLGNIRSKAQREAGLNPGSSVSKEPVCSAGNPGPSPGSGRFPGEGNAKPLQYPSL